MVTSLLTRLAHSFSTHADRPALRCGEAQWTYADLDLASLAAADTLQSHGLRPGDRVALWYRNRPELAIWLLGCWRAGMVAAPVDPRFQSVEATAILHNYRPSALIGDPTLVERVGEETLREAGLGVDREGRYWRRPDADIPDGEGGWPVDGDRTPALIVHTSGTTRAPKGVTHSHGSLSYNIGVQTASQRLASDDVCLLNTTLARTAAITSLLNTLSVGATAVLIPPADIDAVLTAIPRQRVTRLLFLASQLRNVTLHGGFRATDFGSVRACLAGGDWVPLEAHNAFAEFTGLEVTELCAMTECSHFLSNPPFGQRIVGSVGMPLEGVEVRLEDDPTHPDPEGKTGEIMVRTPGTMLGYWNNPTATTGALRDDGWLHTGDLATLDQYGYYWFIGRKKPVIVRDGSCISPEEVKFTIVEHPSVRDAVVKGEYDVDSGEVPVAWICPRRGASVTEDELRRFLTGRLAEYKIPARFYLQA